MSLRELRTTTCAYTVIQAHKCLRGQGITGDWDDASYMEYLCIMLLLGNLSQTDFSDVALPTGEVWCGMQAKNSL